MKAHEWPPSSEKPNAFPVEFSRMLLTYRDSELQTSQKARKKKSHRKTRTGCQVCRVKCDETKPSCNRCTSTGRNCDGYPRASVSSTEHRVLAPKAPGLSSRYGPSCETPGDNAERRSLCYLRERVLCAISGYFDCRFWNRLALQTSHTEPAVRHALVALSSLCETYELRAPMSGGARLRNQFALQHYHKAVNLLTAYFSAPYVQLNVVLVSCLVFFWFELLSNDPNAGLVHLKCGLRILLGIQQPNKTPASASQPVDASLMYLFRRIETQVNVYGSSSVEYIFEGDEETQQLILPASFSSLEQATDTLHALLGGTSRFFKHLQIPRFMESITDSHPRPNAASLEATRRLHLTQFSGWQAAIERSPYSIFKSLNTQNTAALRLLYIYHKAMTIVLETLFNHSQMIYDRYDWSFDEILTLAEQLLNSPEHMNLVVFNSGVIGPLFFVAVKCRNLGLRKKALSLLRRAPCREGMWLRQDAIEFTEWKIGVEERGRGQLPESEALPEEARIWNEHMGKAVINKRQRTVVSFQSRSGDGMNYGKDVTDLNLRSLIL